MKGDLIVVSMFNDKVEPIDCAASFVNNWPQCRTKIYDNGYRICDNMLAFGAGNYAWVRNVYEDNLSAIWNHAISEGYYCYGMERVFVMNGDILCHPGAHDIFNQVQERHPCADIIVMSDKHYSFCAFYISKRLWDTGFRFDEDTPLRGNDDLAIVEYCGARQGVLVCIRNSGIEHLGIGRDRENAEMLAELSKEARVKKQKWIDALPDNYKDYRKNIIEVDGKWKQM